MSIVLDKYKIEFSVKIYESQVTGIKENLPILSTNDISNYILVMFFMDYLKAVHIQSDILNVINDVMNNTILEGETGSQSGIAVYIKSDVTKFVYFGGTGTYLSPDLTIPTVDFNQLAVEWKDYIVNHVSC